MLTPPFVIKVCGITAPGDADAAVEAGATALGFNFYPDSPRYVEPSKLAEWAGEVPEGVLRVGVFVDAPAEVVARTVALCRLHVAQLHGAPVDAGVRTWLARHVDENFHASALGAEAEAWLLDAPAGVLPGGTGRVFDWNLARGLRAPIVLAGGLDASNVARAIELVRPWGVDACSRLESSPGRKDRARVEAFVAAAREAERALALSMPPGAVNG